MYYRPNNLKEHRLRMGLRQLDVACRLGFTTTDRISHWEKGQAYPSIVNLFKLAGIYQVHPHELYPHIWEEVQGYQ